jgi:uncharacterized protein involved in exopolysaccharide biosynthesis
MRETLENRQTLLQDDELVRLAGQQPATPREKWIDALGFLLEARRWILKGTLCGFLLSTLLAFTLPKRYESTANLMPPDNASGANVALLASAASRAGAFGGIAADLLGVKSSSALFVGILQSRTVQDRLIEALDLKRVYGQSTLDDARKMLAARTVVTEDRRSGIVTLRVMDRLPHRAQAIAQGYVEQLDRLVAEVSTSSARREREFIEERLRVVKQEWNEAAKAFSEFSSKNTTIDIKEQGRAMVEAAANLQAQLISARTQLQSLMQIYTGQNVRVRSLQAQVSELERQLQKLGGAIPAPEGESQGDGPYPSIRTLPLLGVPYADLYRRTKIAETVFELLTQQYELAKVQEAKEIPTVKVLDAPVVPEKKVFPPRVLIIAFGTFLTLSFCLMWSLMAYGWQDVEPNDPRRVFARHAMATLKGDLTESPAGVAWRWMLPWVTSKRMERGSHHQKSSTP